MILGEDNPPPPPPQRKKKKKKKEAKSETSPLWKISVKAQVHGHIWCTKLSLHRAKYNLDRKDFEFCADKNFSIKVFKI